MGHIFITLGMNGYKISSGQLVNKFEGSYRDWKDVETLWNSPNHLQRRVAEKYLRKHKQILIPSFTHLKGTYGILKKQCQIEGYWVCPKVSKLASTQRAFQDTPTITQREYTSIKKYIKESHSLLNEYQRSLKQLEYNTHQMRKKFKQLYIEWKDIENSVDWESGEQRRNIVSFLRRHKGILLPSFYKLKYIYYALEKTDRTSIWTGVSYYDIETLNQYIFASRKLLSEFREKYKSIKDKEKFKKDSILATSHLRKRSIYGKNAYAFYIFTSKETKKIGISNNPKRRCREHTRNTNMEFKIYKVIWLKSQKKAQKLESEVIKWLHNNGYQRTGKEFFRTSTAVIEKAIGECDLKFRKKGIFL